jgi:hypothetical protein
MKQIQNKRLFLIFAFLLFFVGVFLGHYSYVLKKQTTNFITKVKGKANTYFTDMSDVPIIHLTIPEESFEKLSIKRTEAMKNGILIKNEDDEVIAEINYLNITSAVKIRLKGDGADHFNTDKWSFRVKTDIPIMGMKRFSLQHPKTRGFLSEWFFQEALKQEGIISLRIYFVKIIVNGKDNGVYIVEEFFDDELLRVNNCAPAPILKFNEDNVWKEMYQYGDSGIAKNIMFEHVEFRDIETSYVEAFQQNKLLNDSVLSEQLLYAKDLLYRFLDSELIASKVFDSEKMPKYMALCEALEAEHALFWNNLRFYFNPQTQLLEPIGYDAFISQHDVKNHFSSSLHADKFIRLLLNDSVCAYKYNYWLNQYTQPSFLNKLQKELKDSIEKNLKIVHTEWPDATLPTEIWEVNRKLIQISLFPPSSFYAYLKQITDEEISIETDNISGMAVEIMGLIVDDSITIVPTNKTILLRFPQLNTALFRTDFLIKQSSKLTLKYRVLGLKDIREEKIIPFSRTAQSSKPKTR